MKLYLPIKFKKKNWTYYRIKIITLWYRVKILLLLTFFLSISLFLKKKKKKKKNYII